VEEELKQKNFLKILKERDIVLGGSLFDVQNKEPSQPYVDQINKLHWPVMFIYEEYSQVDFIQDFQEDQNLGEHLDTMFPPNEFPIGTSIRNTREIASKLTPSSIT